MTRIVLTLLMLTGTVYAKDFTVTDDDQKIIAQICQAAAQRQGADIRETANIATWCVMWSNRMQAAEKSAEKSGQTNP